MEVNLCHEKLYFRKRILDDVTLTPDCVSHMPSVRWIMHAVGATSIEFVNAFNSLGVILCHDGTTILTFWLKHGRPVANEARFAIDLRQ